ncbi:MAG TPA: YkoF family thiamine/hydroxymethylpyrimidine-binding protein [Flavobacteriaceae bacterium]|nr:YkoF family thiamine/hydroxymethylpyrimidine-binding protein [Flavobacteriaceae bacterium]
MKISVELTLVPIQDEFKDVIKAFILQLRNSKFEVLENPLSTQIYGDYQELMPFLTNTIENTFKNTEHVLVNMKIVKSDRSSYEPSF